MILHPFLGQINKVLILLKPPITITFVAQEYASFPDGCSTVFMEAEQICRSCKSLPSIPCCQPKSGFSVCLKIAAVSPCWTVIDYMSH